MTGVASAVHPWLSERLAPPRRSRTPASTGSSPHGLQSCSVPRRGNLRSL